MGVARTIPHRALTHQARGEFGWMWRAEFGQRYQYGVPMFLLWHRGYIRALLWGVIKSQSVIPERAELHLDSLGWGKVGRGTIVYEPGVTHITSRLLKPETGKRKPQTKISGSSFKVTQRDHHWKNRLIKSSSDTIIIWKGNINRTADFLFDKLIFSKHINWKWMMKW